MTAPLWARHLPTPDHPWFPDDLAERGLTAAFTRHWEAEPDRPLFHDAERGWVTRGEFAALTARAAGALVEAGVRPGDRVLTSGAGRIDLVVAHVAALRLGAVVVPVHTGYTERELGHVLDDAGPVIAVIDDGRRTANLAPDLPVVTPTALVATDATPATDLDRARPDDVALLPYTSGTTGRPKGVGLTHANLLAGALAVVTAWRWTAADRLVIALPLFHMHGLGVGVHGTLASGGSAVILDGFSPDGVLDAAAAHEATMYFGVPTMYQRLVGHERVAELGRLRLCVSGSAPLPAELHEAVTAATGRAVIERYGMTETVMNISNPFVGERRPGSIGLPLPGVEARIDPAVADGEDGEIQLRGPNVFGGYWNRPEATAEAFTDDGWFRTGDVGRLEADGYWSIVGRAKELIISGGFNVFPREVEDVLVDHPAIAEAAVAGVPDPEWGEVVTALIVAEPGATIDVDEVKTHCTDRLVNYKRPRRLHVVASLPRNALGKIVRPDVTAEATRLSE